MFELSVKSEFSSAHSLRGYKGKCEALHGHNWKVEARIKAETLDKLGLVIDFHQIKSALKGVTQELDHKYLNELPHFKKANPTSENLARYIYEKLKPALDAGGARLSALTVWESDNCSATYSK